MLTTLKIGQDTYKTLTKKAKVVSNVLDAIAERVENGHSLKQVVETFTVVNSNYVINDGNDGVIFNNGLAEIQVDVPNVGSNDKGLTLNGMLELYPVKDENFEFEYTQMGDRIIPSFLGYRHETKENQSTKVIDFTVDEEGELIPVFQPVHSEPSDQPGCGFTGQGIELLIGVEKSRAMVAGPEVVNNDSVTDNLRKLIVDMLQGNPETSRNFALAVVTSGLQPDEVHDILNEEYVKLTNSLPEEELNNLINMMIDESRRHIKGVDGLMYQFSQKAIEKMGSLITTAIVRSPADNKPSVIRIDELVKSIVMAHFMGDLDKWLGTIINYPSVDKATIIELLPLIQDTLKKQIPDEVVKNFDWRNHVKKFVTEKDIMIPRFGILVRTFKNLETIIQFTPKEKLGCRPVVRNEGYINYICENMVRYFRGEDVNIQHMLTYTGEELLVIAGYMFEQLTNVSGGDKQVNLTKEVNEMKQNFIPETHIHKGVSVNKNSTQTEEQVQKEGWNTVLAESQTKDKVDLSFTEVNIPPTPIRDSGLLAQHYEECFDLQGNFIADVYMVQKLDEPLLFIGVGGHAGLMLCVPNCERYNEYLAEIGKVVSPTQHFENSSFANTHVYLFEKRWLEELLVKFQPKVVTQTYPGEKLNLTVKKMTFDKI